MSNAWWKFGETPYVNKSMNRLQNILKKRLIDAGYNSETANELLKYKTANEILSPTGFLAEREAEQYRRKVKENAARITVAKKKWNNNAAAKAAAEANAVQRQKNAIKYIQIGNNHLHQRLEKQRDQHVRTQKALGNLKKSASEPTLPPHFYQAPATKPTPPTNNRMGTSANPYGFANNYKNNQNNQQREPGQPIGGKRHTKRRRHTRRH